MNVRDVVVGLDLSCFRSAEIDSPFGDPSRAKAKQSWSPDITFEQMCAEMMENDREESTKA